MKLIHRIKYIIIIALLATAYVPVSAQYSGYLGKRLSAHWDFSTSPSLSEPTKGNTNPRHSTIEDSGEPIKFNTRHCFDLEWSVNKSFSTGLLYQRVVTRSYVPDGFGIKILNNSNDTGYYTEESNDYYYDDDGNYSAPEQFMEKPSLVSMYSLLKANTIGIFTTFYLDKLNPLGTYLRFEVFRINYKLKEIEYFKDDRDDYSSERLNAKEFEYSKPFVDDKYHTYGFTCRVGKQKVYFNHLLLRYGIQTGMVFGDRFGRNASNFKATDVAFIMSNRRLRNHYLLNFEFGVGYLIF